MVQYLGTRQKEWWVSFIYNGNKALLRLPGARGLRRKKGGLISTAAQSWHDLVAAEDTSSCENRHHFLHANPHLGRKQNMDLWLTGSANMDRIIRFVRSAKILAPPAPYKGPSCLLFFLFFSSLPMLLSFVLPSLDHHRLAVGVVINQSKPTTGIQALSYHRELQTRYIILGHFPCCAWKGYGLGALE